jgi:hypothetical protein
MTWEASAIELEDHLRAALRRHWSRALDQKAERSGDPGTAAMLDARRRLA